MSDTIDEGIGDDGEEEDLDFEDDDDDESSQGLPEGSQKNLSCKILKSLNLYKNFCQF